MIDVPGSYSTKDGPRLSVDHTGRWRSRVISQERRWRNSVTPLTAINESEGENLS